MHSATLDAIRAELIPLGHDTAGPAVLDAVRQAVADALCWRAARAGLVVEGIEAPADKASRRVREMVAAAGAADGAIHRWPDGWDVAMPAAQGVSHRRVFGWSPRWAAVDIIRAERAGRVRRDGLHRAVLVNAARGESCDA